VEPRASWYTNDGTLMRISAETGQITVDTLGGKLGESDKKPSFQIKGGWLSKSVVLTLGPQDSYVAGLTTLQPRQLQVQFEKDIELNYTEHTLESQGKLRIRGVLNTQEVEFDGQDLVCSSTRNRSESSICGCSPMGRW